MNVVSIETWRLPGCGETCQSRQHDPIRHEVYGLLMALWTTPTRVVKTGPLVVDLDARVVTVNRKRVSLSQREWGVLAYLTERTGRWCPHGDILRDVWGWEWVIGRIRHGDISNLRNVVRRLRGKLGPASVLLTNGHPGTSGYRLERVEGEPCVT